jgi:hypothetical protein
VFALILKCVNNLMKAKNLVVQRSARNCIIQDCVIIYKIVISHVFRA